MNKILSNNVILDYKKFRSAEHPIFKIVNILVSVSLLMIAQTALLASALGVSVATAARVAWAAYNAYRAGRSIRVAVSAVLGGGALVWIAIDFIIGWGAAQVVSQSWLLNA